MRLVEGPGSPANIFKGSEARDPKVNHILDGSMDNNTNIALRTAALSRCLPWEARVGLKGPHPIKKGRRSHLVLWGLDGCDLSPLYAKKLRKRTFRMRMACSDFHVKDGRNWGGLAGRPSIVLLWRLLWAWPTCTRLLCFGSTRSRGGAAISGRAGGEGRGALPLQCLPAAGQRALPRDGQLQGGVGRERER